MNKLPKGRGMLTEVRYRINFGRLAPIFEWVDFVDASGDHFSIHISIGGYPRCKGKKNGNYIP